jgi:glycosyltransferase involved in cell wall biosynthesis/SAM-dependent methyltransferase
MRIFVLGVPHTQTTLEFTTCAFTMKVWNLCRMLTERGHEVFHLGTEGSNPVCTRHFSVTPEIMWRELYGARQKEEFYNLDTQGPHKAYHDLYALEAGKIMRAHGGEPYTSIVCATWGGAQAVAVNDVPQQVVESGIGYKHTWAKYRVFESYAWMHMLYGAAGRYEGGGWYDVVIPNSFDPEMFQYSELKQDYFLYLGRLNDDKGVGLAVETAKAAGLPIKLAGQGDPKRFLAGNPHASYCGPVGVEERRELLSNARAMLCPTYYVEPFGGVAVEAQLSGTPVICTDWGAFPETVAHGYTGYRCRTREQFTWAARNIHKLEPAACRKWAIENFSLKRVAHMYEEFFQAVLNLKHAGWNSEHPGRQDLDWLRKVWPVAAPLDTAKAFIPPPDPPTVWQAAHKWESKWWGLERGENWAMEEEKQRTYARLMGLPTPPVSLMGTRVLDIGCGPVSLLFKTINRPTGKRRCVGVDPLQVSEETRERYKQADILFLNMKAEDIPKAGDIPPGGEVFKPGFDEVWIYNCLQHTEDPARILARASELAKVVRIFEWLDLPPCPGHPQTLTEGLFDIAFKGWRRHIWNTGTLAGFGGTVTNRYIAIHAERPKDA